AERSASAAGTPAGPGPGGGCENRRYEQQTGGYPSKSGHLMGLGEEFRAQRRPSEGLHLDSAACGRSAVSVLDAVHAHLELEARAGGYVAQERAAPALNAGRAALAGLLGVPVAGLALTESATASLRAVLAAWPLQAGDVVAVVPSEWGPNLEKFADRGLELALLDVTGDGL